MDNTNEEQRLVNAYTCGNGCGNTIVKHRDQGVTPMFIDCIKCGGRAVSHMYKVPQDLEHDLVAFAPKNKSEWKLYKRHVMEYYRKEWPDYTMNDLNAAIEATKQHIRQGGVVMVPKDKLKL